MRTSCCKIPDQFATIEGRFELDYPAWVETSIGYKLELAPWTFESEFNSDEIDRISRDGYVVNCLDPVTSYSFFQIPR